MIDFNNIIKTNGKVELEITAPIYFWVAFLENAVFYDQKYVTIKSSKEFTNVSFEELDFCFEFEDAKLCDIGKAYLKELQYIKEKYDKDLDTKKRNCLMQLAPSGLNITKQIVIQSAKEYCDSIKANLDKHEIMDIFLYHKKYTVEFQDYIRMIKYITLV